MGQAPVQVQTILEEAALWGTGLEACMLESPPQYRYHPRMYRKRITKTT